MAENKKSFLMYCNWQGTFDSLTDEEAGQLIKHIFSYVNDYQPVSDNRLINLVFEPLKAVLKSDLQKYEQKREKNAENIRKRWNKNDTSEYDRIKSNTNHTDNGKDNDNVKDKVISKDINKKESKSAAIAATLTRIESFRVSLYPFVGEYSKEIVREFFDYWSELNKSQTKMRWELEKTFETKKRLAAWIKNDKKFKNGKNNNGISATSDSDLINAISEGVGRAAMQRN